MKLYIWLKIIVNKLLKNISPLKDEIIFVRDNFPELSWNIYLKKGLSYKQDLLFKRQWDWQYSADILIKNGGGDCNSIHRLFQVYYWMKNYNSYLVTIICDDISKWHTTCIIEKNGEYTLIDYDSEIKCKSYVDCINACQKKYNMRKILSITCQDIYWRVKKEI